MNEETVKSPAVNTTDREYLKNKKRIVVKIGSSSLVHPETGCTDLNRIEKLVRVLSDLANSGKEVILVSSGAIPIGRKALGMTHRPEKKSEKQACAAVGQANLMMLYQKLFAEYQHIVAQVLLTKYTVLEEESRKNAENTFNELLGMGVIPIVNENDTVATDEIEFGDNDTLSAIVTALVNADLLILLSDIDGLYTDDPRTNPQARFIDTVESVSEEIASMGKGVGSDFGTGGMMTKISAARIASESGADMVIANSRDISVVSAIINGQRAGTLFKAHKTGDFQLTDHLKRGLQ